MGRWQTRSFEVELKAKHQRYVGWSQLRPDVAVADLFILDELALRHLVDAGRYGFLHVRDVTEASGTSLMVRASPTISLLAAPESPRTSSSETLGAGNRR